MSEFLDKGRAEKGSLRKWVTASVCEMDRIMDEGFPQVFGENWRINMRHFKTAARTKLLTYVFNHALEKKAQESGVLYRVLNNEGVGGNNFDCSIYGYGVHNILCLGKEATSFATGNAFLPGDANRILAVKVRLDKYYKTEEFFAALVDLSEARNNSDTKWHGEGVKNGFSSLKVACDDANIIVSLCGDIRPRRKYFGTEYEQFHPRENCV